MCQAAAAALWSGNYRCPVFAVQNWAKFSKHCSTGSKIPWLPIDLMTPGSKVADFCWSSLAAELGLFSKIWRRHCGAPAHQLSLPHEFRQELRRVNFELIGGRNAAASRFPWHLLWPGVPWYPEMRWDSVTMAFAGWICKISKFAVPFAQSRTLLSLSALKRLASGAKRPAYPSKLYPVTSHGLIHSGCFSFCAAKIGEQFLYWLQTMEMAKYSWMARSHR